MLYFKINNQEQKKIREIKGAIENLKLQPSTEENESRILTLESQIRQLEHALKARNFLT